ncbi:MAG: BCAM0308 family protein [Gammaproteobacteria bacterium]|nr:BCAM0308 family protein [Gammaproteobacteria bacterium]MDH5800358.1 BCAM0308 family protein [Gammaproteobacteria bacterium]
MHVIDKPGKNTVRRDRFIKELQHDPYHSKLKLKSATQCPQCYAVYSRGHWTWERFQKIQYHHYCPACSRIRDKVPAAYLNLSGGYVETHKRDIINLIHNYEVREKLNHPLKRVMAMREVDSELQVQFTDAHLARGVGTALKKAHGGEIQYHYGKEDVLLRIAWSRN